MKDIIQELCDEFPEIDKGSIEKICKAGMAGIGKILRSDEELLIRTENHEEIKFYIPCGPVVQDKITETNRKRHRFANIKPKDGEKSI